MTKVSRSSNIKNGQTMKNGQFRSTIQNGQFRNNIKPAFTRPFPKIHRWTKPSILSSRHYAGIVLPYRGFAEIVLPSHGPVGNVSSFRGITGNVSSFRGFAGNVSSFRGFAGNVSPFRGHVGNVSQFNTVFCSPSSSKFITCGYGNDNTGIIVLCLGILFGSPLLIFVGCILVILG